MGTNSLEGSQDWIDLPETKPLRVLSSPEGYMLSALSHPKT